MPHPNSLPSNTRFFIWTAYNERYEDNNYVHLAITDTEVLAYSAHWEETNPEDYDRDYVTRHLHSATRNRLQWTEVTRSGFEIIMNGYSGAPLMDASFLPHTLPFSPLFLKPPKTILKIGVPKSKLP